MRNLWGRAVRGHATERLAGSIVIMSLGLIAVVEGLSLPVGTVRQIGPGAMPVGLGIILLALGAAFFFDVPEYEDYMPRFVWRPLIATVAAMASFALFIELSGMLAAIIALIAISEFAERHYSWKKVVLSSLALCLFMAGIKFLLRGSLILDLY